MIKRSSASQVIHLDQRFQSLGDDRSRGVLPQFNPKDALYSIFPTVITIC
jgi:hypothetical protein